MVLFLILGIVLGVMGLNFALQNTQEVTVAFFAWDFTAPLALVIFGSMLVSIGIAIVALIPSAIRESFEAYVLRRELRRADAATYASSSDPQVS